MDVNHAKGSPLFAPIRFDTHAYFDSLAMGDNNNRWRGIRRWRNEDVWALQSHHLIDLLVPENTLLQPGTKYATTAGVHVGSHEHTHFEFKIGRARGDKAGDPESIATPVDFDDESELAQQDPEVLHLDPWVFFWQSFEDRKAERGEIRAAMQPLDPARTGESVTFSASGSTPGHQSRQSRYFWTFSDGGTAEGPAVAHVFPRPGLFSVRLEVDDGQRRDSTIQWLTVHGRPASQPVLTLTVPEEPSFRPWPQQATEVYGQSVDKPAHMLCFVARPSHPHPDPKIIRLTNIGGDRLREFRKAKIAYEQGSGWLDIEHQGKDSERKLSLTVNGSGLEPGEYRATVRFACPEASNSPQQFRVELMVPEDPPGAEVTIDDAGPGFYATPYFWVGHRFCRCPADQRGYAGFYLTNGGRADPGQFARFTPDLQAGRYEVFLSDETPFSPGVEFDVRIRHAEGEETVRVQPKASRAIGTFAFQEGMDGYIEILAEGSKGLVIADAVVFRKTDL
jgi:hypothetical protein